MTIPSAPRRPFRRARVSDGSDLGWRRPKERRGGRARRVPPLRQGQSHVRGWPLLSFLEDRPRQRHGDREPAGRAAPPVTRGSLPEGYVYYSPDFTPIATGFSEWGKWYLGNQIDWIVFSTNTKVLRAAAGLWPLETTKLQLQYHRTSEARPSGSSTGGPLSNESSLIAEWYPTRWLWSNLLLGYSAAGRALAASGLQNPFSALYSGAVPVGTGRSFDAVLAVGLKF